MASSISAARGALFDKLYNSAGLNGVQVTYGRPDAHEDPEVVALLGVRDPDEEAAAIGRGSKDETYELVVGVKVHGRSSTAREVDTRAYQLADAIADAVEGDGDYTLGVPAVLWALVTSTTGEGALPAEGGGWVVFLNVVVTCVARIERRRA